MNSTSLDDDLAMALAREFALLLAPSYGDASAMTDLIPEDSDGRPDDGSPPCAEVTLHGAERDERMSVFVGTPTGDRWQVGPKDIVLDEHSDWTSGVVLVPAPAAIAAFLAGDPDAQTIAIPLAGMIPRAKRVAGVRKALRTPTPQGDDLAGKVAETAVSASGRGQILEAIRRSLVLLTADVRYATNGKSLVVEGHDVAINRDGWVSVDGGIPTPIHDEVAIADGLKFTPSLCIQADWPFMRFGGGNSKKGTP